MSNLLKKEKGFTLIEIVLVLAIAGLLLVIVFLALQGAQRSRRDQQRKQDAATALAAMESCASNHDGQYANCLAGNLIGAGKYYSGKDPNNTAYAPVANAGAITGAAMMFPNSATCPAATSGTASVTVYQESGGTYCVHN